MFNPFRALKSWYRMKQLRRIFRLLEKSGFAPLPIIKGGVIPLPVNVNVGYQPTESVKTQPPDVSSGVQPPKSGSNAQKPITYPHNIILTGSPNCKGVVYFPKAEGEKKKHKVYIPLETAKRINEKKRIPHLERQIPFPAFVENEKFYNEYYGEYMEIRHLRCPRCGMRIETTDKKCKYCFQRVDFKEVTKDD